MIQAHILAGLVQALCLVESGGNPNAVNGPCVGILQIKPVVVTDLNRIAGREKWRMADRWIEARAKVMCMDYLLHYGQDMTVGELADLWHRGPTGMNRPMKLADKDYVERVVALAVNMEGGK